MFLIFICSYFLYFLYFHFVSIIFHIFIFYICSNIILSRQPLIPKSSVVNLLPIETIEINESDHMFVFDAHEHADPSHKPRIPRRHPACRHGSVIATIRCDSMRRWLRIVARSSRLRIGQAQPSRRKAIRKVIRKAIREAIR